jgi:hypothetical protein
VELLDLTIADERWKGRRKELTRTRELLCDAMFGGNTYGSNLASLDRYFFHFAMLACSSLSFILAPSSCTISL